MTFRFWAEDRRSSSRGGLRPATGSSARPRSRLQQEHAAGFDAARRQVHPLAHARGYNKNTLPGSMRPGDRFSHSLTLAATGRTLCRGQALPATGFFPSGADPVLLLGLNESDVRRSDARSRRRWRGGSGDARGRGTKHRCARCEPGPRLFPAGRCGAVRS